MLALSIIAVLATIVFTAAFFATGNSELYDILQDIMVALILLTGVSGAILATVYLAKV